MNFLGSYLLLGDLRVAVTPSENLSNAPSGLLFLASRRDTESGLIPDGPSSLCRAIISSVLTLATGWPSPLSDLPLREKLPRINRSRFAHFLSRFQLWVFLK